MDEYTNDEEEFLTAEKIAFLREKYGVPKPHDTRSLSFKLRQRAGTLRWRIIDAWRHARKPRPV